MFQRILARRKLGIAFVFGLTVLLIGMTVLGRNLFAMGLDKDAHYILDQQWTAMKGFLRIENPTDKPLAAWYYDAGDPDQSLMVQHLQQNCLLTDATGDNVLFISGNESLDKESPHEIQARVSTAVASYGPRAGGKTFYAERYTKGVPCVVRSGIVFDERHKAPFYVAIAIPLTGPRQVLSEFTLVFIAALVSALLLGWGIGRIIIRNAATVSR
jgi:hypothetical protein